MTCGVRVHKVGGPGFRETLKRGFMINRHVDNCLVGGSKGRVRERLITASWHYWVAYWPTLSSFFFFFSFLFLFLFKKYLFFINYFFVLQRKKEALYFVERERLECDSWNKDSAKPTETLDFLRLKHIKFTVFHWFSDPEGKD